MTHPNNYQYQLRWRERNHEKYLKLKQLTQKSDIITNRLLRNFTELTYPFSNKLKYYISFKWI